MGRGEHLQIGTYVGKPLDERALRQHDRRLPGRRADQQAVPLPGARVGIDRARIDRLSRRARLATCGCTRVAAKRCARVPRDNEAINECWLSDRDRYQLRRLVRAPIARRRRWSSATAHWVETDWNEAIRRRRAKR